MWAKKRGAGVNVRAKRKKQNKHVFLFTFNNGLPITTSAPRLLLFFNQQIEMMRAAALCIILGAAAISGQVTVLSKANFDAEVLNPDP